jgi:predicted nucleic acid-binding protein
MSAKPFLDTNILIYAFATGDPRETKAEALLAAGGIISVQVLNEFTNVMRRKRNWKWADVESALEVLRTLLDRPVPLTFELHRAAISLARDYGLAFYDSLIVAAAHHAECSVVYSEDMQNEQKIGTTTVRNPFAAT